MPTAAEIAVEIAPLIVVPEAPEAPSIVTVGTDRIDRLCELTDGCEYWDAEGYALDEILDNRFNLDDNEEVEDDFKEEFADLVGLDYDRHDQYSRSEIEFEVYNLHEDDNGVSYQIRANTDDYPEYQLDNDWEIVYLVRVEYRDVDDNDDETEIVYVLVTTTLDEGDYDGSLDIEEVNRRYEFD